MSEARIIDEIVTDVNQHIDEAIRGKNYGGKAVFTRSGRFIVPNGVTTISILAVGGAGSADASGGTTIVGNILSVLGGGIGGHMPGPCGPGGQDGSQSEAGKSKGIGGTSGGGFGKGGDSMVLSSASTMFYGGGGGGIGAINADVVAGAVISITVGLGGAGSAFGNKGTDGIVFIEW